MKVLIPVISSALALHNVQLVSHTETSILLGWEGDNSTDYSIAYEEVRADYMPNEEMQDNAVEAFSIGQVLEYEVTGLTAARFYMFTVSSANNETQTFRARTNGRGIFISDIQYWKDGNKTGNILRGAIMADTTGCYDQFRVTLNKPTCSFTSITADLPQDQVRAVSVGTTAFDFVVSDKAEPFFTFQAEFDQDFFDDCFEGIMEEAANPALESGSGMGDFFGDAAQGLFTIDDSNDNQVLDLSFDVEPTLFQATDNEYEPSIRAQVHFNLAEEAQTNTTYADAVCGFDVTITFSDDCPVAEFNGNVSGAEFTQLGNAFSATSPNAYNSYVFFQLLVESDAENCDADVVKPTINVSFSTFV